MRPRMPFPGHGLRSRTVTRGVRRRSPRRILGTCFRAVCENQPRGRPGRRIGLAVRRRRGQQRGDARVPQADDACIRQAASARAPLSPRSRWTTSRRPAAAQSPQPRFCIVERQQSRSRYRVPCNSRAPAVIFCTRGALLLSCTQASVAEFRRQTLAPDDVRVPRRAMRPLPHRPGEASARVNASRTLPGRRGCRTNPRFCPFAGGNWRMPQNFLEGHREQGFLLPPDVREWLAADHLAWFVIDAVAEMDLSAFYGAYRADGHGRRRMSRR